MHNESTRQKTRDSKFVITGDQKKRERFYVMKFTFPQLYSQRELHKPEQSIRPEVAFYSDSTFQLARYLVDWFKTVRHFQPTYSIKNSTKLAQKLQNLKFSALTKLISFDVECMYSRIPVQKVINIKTLAPVEVD